MRREYPVAWESEYTLFPKGERRGSCRESTFFLALQTSLRECRAGKLGSGDGFACLVLRSDEHTSSWQRPCLVRGVRGCCWRRPARCLTALGDPA